MSWDVFWKTAGLLVFSIYLIIIVYLAVLYAYVIIKHWAEKRKEKRNG